MVKIIKRCTGSPFALACASFFLYYLALAPAHLAILAFFVPIIWIRLFYFTIPKEQKRANIRFYGQLWGGASVFWLAITWWLILPHPATILGWFAISGYLAIYFPLFIALVRWGIRQRFPLIPTVLLAWLFAEWLRKNMLGGFSFASLEHSFYRLPVLIQIADLASEYGVGLFIVFIGTALGKLIFPQLTSWQPETEIFCAQKIEVTGIERVRRILLFFTILITFGAVIGYGYWRIGYWQRLESQARQQGKRPIRVALLQEKTPFHFPVPEEVDSKISRQYMELTRSVVREQSPIDLVVWPESSFGQPYWQKAPSYSVKTNSNDSKQDESTDDDFDAHIAETNKFFSDWSQAIGSAILVGTTTVVVNPDETLRIYNSALWIDREKPIERYDKTHLVMFGEYFPGASLLPDSFPLKTLCQSVTPGDSPIAFRLDNNCRSIRILTNICFESSIARLIKRQIRELRKQSLEPDILINMSNDGWFWHSPQIEYHLATHVFRAVENRKPVLSATHAGYSAWIDPTGTIRAQGRRASTEAVIAELVIP